MPPPTPERAPIFIIGHGDIGHRVARLEQARGSKVLALSRAAPAGAADGVGIIRGDLDHPETLGGFPPEISTLYYFAPPPATGDQDPRIAGALNALPGIPERIVYISTSGVYGDSGGAWIDESWPLNPGTARGRRRLFAEDALRDWGRRHGAGVVMLRVPGIYGPGRLPVERVRRQVPVIDPREAPYTNRIHADDLAAACLAAARHGQPGQAYNISDGHPTTMTDYFWRIADHLGLPRPPAIGLAEAREVLSPAMLSFLEESRRLINRRMREELGLEPRYPDLGAGLRACD